MLKLQELTEIIKLIDQSSISRLELEYEAIKLVIDKHRSDVPALSGAAVQRSSAVADTGPEMANKPEQQPVTEQLQTITAPMVGTLYLASEPGAEPFVQIGQKITTETVVCILEAMKLFNETEAGIDGEIVEILVEDGQLVEYGQPLFLVKPE